MSEQLSFYKLFKSKRFSIEIPIIQRDYAQGRESASEIRENFLLALKKYLDDAIPFRDLDFVYGDVDKNNALTLLDGQQRLTTLFLLHWYISCKEERLEEFNNVLFQDGISKFSYKTRQSSTDFCNALLNILIDLQNLLPPDEGKLNALSKSIRNNQHYFLSWNFDPTIQSMLNMLDDIHNLYYETKSKYYDLLIDLDKPIITFQFLPLSDYGLTDDLYIKMNSRGKPLSKFENFKAKFESHLKQFDNENKYQLNLSTQIKEVGVSEYFSFKIDTDWADFFWNFKDKSDNTCDAQLMNLINTLAINNNALHKNELKSYSFSNNSLNFNLYASLSIDFIKSIVAVFDAFCISKSFNKVLNDFHYYSEITVFEKIINSSFSNSGYQLNVLFFAYYSYLIQWPKNKDGIKDWMRVVCNLTKNTPQFNDDTDYTNAINSLSKILPYSEDILTYLKTDPDIAKFNLNQVKEEKIKAHLLGKSDVWKDKIIESEGQLYFEGQLTFAIAFSGIEDYFDINKNCNWNSIEDGIFFSKFSSYIEKVFGLFDSSGLLKQVSEDHLFHRAILSKGDYTLRAQANYSFLIDSHRDISWKRLLLGDISVDQDRKIRRNYFKQLIDDPLFIAQGINSLSTMVSNIDPGIELWRIKFISSPELFSYLGQRKFIRYIDDDKIYLVKSVKISGEHAELFSYCLYLKLQKIDIKPFCKLHYYFTYSYPDSSGIFLSDFNIKEKEYKIRILYIGIGQYKIWFTEKENNPIEKSIKNILKINLFIELGDVLEIELSENKVIKSLKKLCSDLFSINHFE
jgi:hypothetical protein